MPGTIRAPAKEEDGNIGPGVYMQIYTEYLALSIQRKGITYYRRVPVRRARARLFIASRYIFREANTKRTLAPLSFHRAYTAFHLTTPTVLATCTR